MSYILDALKKAEAERNGARPHAIPTLPGFTSMKPRRSGWRNSPWMWGTLAALTVVAIGTAWIAMPAKPMRPQPVAQSPATIAFPPPVAIAAPKDATTIVAEEELAKPKEKTVKKPVEKKRSSASDEPNEARPPAPKTEPPIATLRELPEQIQREIPPLEIGGYIYSGNKSDRSVLINKRLLREGDAIAPGLMLEKMTQTGMVLNYKGYRYRTSY